MELRSAEGSNPHSQSVSYQRATDVESVIANKKTLSKLKKQSSNTKEYLQ